MSSIELIKIADQQEFLKRLTDDFTKVIAPAILSRGRANVSLSGGSTPKPFYSHLNHCGIVRQNITWWLGDERWVPADNDLSNEKMVRATLGQGIADFSSRFQTWHLSQDPAEAASLFEEKLCHHLGVPPIFDLILLGVGTDGHTASLFPGTEAVKESSRFAVANQVPQQNGLRLTMTYPTLNAANEIWFLVSGKDKEPMVNRLVQRDPTIPSACITAKKQKLFWLVA